MADPLDPIQDKTIGFCPEYYDEMVASWSKSDIIKPEYLFLGDSITEQGNWIERIKDHTVVNHGIKGDISISVLRRLEEAIRQKPKTILLMIGTNDLAKRVSTKEIIENTFEIIKRLEESLPETTLILQSILPINNSVPYFESRFDNGEAILKINSELQDKASKKNLRYLDLHSTFRNEVGQLKAAFTTDGLHLNNEGYNHWESVLRAENIL